MIGASLPGGLECHGAVRKTPRASLTRLVALLVCTACSGTPSPVRFAAFCEPLFTQRPRALPATAQRRRGAPAEAPRRNAPTTSARRAACSLRLSAAAVDSSTRAAFCWVIWSSWVTATFTWPMPWLCSDAAALISPMMSVTRRTELTISSIVVPAFCTSAEPDSTFSTETPISVLISLAAWAERWASERTSLATTAKPRPCSPARAASTAALRARMLVWKAMPSMVPMMSEIFLLLALISSMVLTTWETTSPPRWAT